MLESSMWLKSCLLVGTLLIGAYVIFGGASVTHKRRRKKKDVIPGLPNIGNSCFLNALVQSLASCPIFMAWLSSKHTLTAPPLLNTLHSLLKALNDAETGADACAGEVLGALRGHGWVITSEEQDTHELFHVLTTTIEDEIISGAPVPSLLDISWLDAKQEEMPGEGVTLRAAVWRLSVTTQDLETKSDVHAKEELNGVVCGYVHDLAHFRLCEDRGGEGSERCGSEVEVPSCDMEGCDRHAMFPGLQKGGQGSNAQDAEEVVRNGVSSRNLNKEKTSYLNVEGGKSEGVTDISEVSSCVRPPECDRNKNLKENPYLHKVAKKPLPKAGRIQDTESACRKPHSDHHQDIPFRGYLASQLQCTVCGHKNPAQWSSFESLSLSLPSLPWGEVSLQELLGTYITQEQVSGVSCEACTGAAALPVKTTFTKQLTIGKLPDCLCFHVKRTVWLENGSAIKRRDHVTFPEFLVMDPYTYTTSITSQNQKREEGQGKVPCQGPRLLNNHRITALSHSSSSSHPEPSSLLFMGQVHCDQLYRLQAVIVHVGDVFCGHFVTYRRGPTNSQCKNRWFYTSDLLVREASLEEVRKANAYMILYEKVA